MLGLVLTVPANEAELASDALWALGVAAIEERGGTSGTEDDLVELWTSLGDDAPAVARAAEGFPARWRWKVIELDPSVTETWRAHAHASWIEKDLVVVPAWLPFEDPPGGSGSGVLAVAAAVLGAERVTGIDISLATPAVAAANAEANGVGARVEVTTTPLADIEGTFDVVLANLLAPALLALADDLVRVVAPGGALVISGLLADRYEHVVAALAPLQPVERRTKEGWTAITLRH